MEAPAPVEARAALNPAVAAARSREEVAARNQATLAVLNREVASQGAEAVAPTHATEVLAPLQAPARLTPPVTRDLLALPVTRVLLAPPALLDRPAVQQLLLNKYRTSPQQNGGFPTAVLLQNTLKLL